MLNSSRDMDPDSRTPSIPAIATDEWDRRPDPNPEPRRNGRRMSRYTQEDIFQPIIEDGRKYQGFMPDEYPLPMDGEEQDRLDFNHQLFKVMLDGHLSVVTFEEPPKLAVDLCTGTGIWAIEFAEQNPTSLVYGTDLSAIQPPPRTENCSWILENSEKQEWTYWEPPDYLHLRASGTCFDDFGAMLRKCYDNLRPGGWIELQDCALELRCDDGTTASTVLPDFFLAMNRGATMVGRDLLRPKEFGNYLEAAGFVHVQIIELAVPGSPWPEDPKMKLCGYYAGRGIYAAAKSYQKILKASGLKQEQVAELIKRLEKDLSRIDIHWYMPWYIAIARKPFDPPSTHSPVPYPT